MEMPFGLWTRVGPRKHVFDGALVCSPDPHAKGQLLWEMTCPAYQRNLYHEMSKMAEPIDLPFAL